MWKSEGQILSPSLAYFRLAAKRKQDSQFGGYRGVSIWLNKDKICVEIIVN